MSNYGVTPNGFVKKRLDEIIRDIQKDMSDKLGFDVSINQQSYLNVLITTYADRIAQLWEVAEQVYFSQYPSTAEGINLDNAGQFGGVLRKQAERTKYTILCTGNDGTLLPTGTRIASNTVPAVYFSTHSDHYISRRSMTQAIVKTVSVSDATSYSVELNGTSYSITSGSGATASSIMTALASAITDTGFTVTATSGELSIVCNNHLKSNSMVLSSNLTTKSVSSLVVFQSDEYGKVELPENSITNIITTVVGFASCSNIGTPTYGRLRESDIEYRQSYIKKIGTRSSMMIESITAAILDEVDGVLSAVGYENATNSTDADGRPPHSIEIVVDGGDNSEIAAQILRKKAAGISTHGSVSVQVPDVYGGSITVNFNRPSTMYVWMQITVTPLQNQKFPTGYETIIKNAIIEKTQGLCSGDSIFTQDFIADIKSKCSGIGYIDIATSSSTTLSQSAPVTYPDRNVIVTARQKASVADSRIVVVLDD